MLNLQNAGRVALLLSVTALAGCGGGYYRAGVVVGGPPPPPVYGVVGYSPGPAYIWTDGFYDMRGGRWVWVNGRWARPPYRGARWTRPYWEPRGRGYRFHKGYWSR